MLKYKKPILIVTAILSALILFSAFILPVIVRTQAVKAIEKAIGRPANIEKVAINPFTLTLTISGFRIKNQDGTPFIGIDRLRLSVSTASIFKRALVLNEVTFDAPSINFARLAANSYSFSDIMERLKAQPKKESKGEARYSINNISIKNGSINFDDRAVEGGRTHTIKNLEVAVPFISNIPYLVEKYIDPKLSAVVNGANFSFGGKLKPLSKSMESAVKIDLKKLDLPRYVAYAPHKLPVNLISGALTVDAEINYKVSADKIPELNIKGIVRLDDIAINLTDGRPLVKVPSFQLNASRLEVFTRQFAFDSILLEGLEIFASRDRNGKWMYAGLLPKTTVESSAKPDKSAKPEKPEKSAVSVASFLLNNASVHFSDSIPVGGFKATVSEIDISAHNISTIAAAKADYELSMLLDNEATFNADGTFSVSPVAATVSAELSDLKLQKGWPYLAQFLTAPVKGTVGLSADISYSGDEGLKAANGKLEVKGVSTRYGDKEGLELALLEVGGIAFSQKENRAEVANIRLFKGDLSLSREVDGSISLLSLLKKNPADLQQSDSGKENVRQQAAPPVKAVSSGANNGSKPLSWSLKRFQIDRLNSSFTDKSREENPHFTLTNIQLNLTGLKGPKFAPTGLKFSSTFNKETPLKVSGELTPLPFRYKGEISVGRLHIRDFEDYFPENLNVFVVSGTVDTTMNVDVALNEGKPSGSFKGSSGVRSFHSVDMVAEEDLLKWESLQLDEIQGTIEPFSLAIHQVSLSNPYSRIVVRKDGTLNLQNLVDKPEKGMSAATTANVAEKSVPPAAAESKSTAPAIAAQPADKKAKSPISIGAVTIQDGTLSFTDRHLPQTFNSTFYNMGGRVSGLSSEESQLADVDLRGNLENHSPLQITGKINPLKEDLFVDLKVSFKDIDLSPVTPYSGTYLGYTVEKGKLFLDLKYLIDKKQLNSENNVFIDQFTFGAKVESEKATSLPVRLAVALLKDRKGEIHLDLPVTGRTDDPKFSIWGVVWQVFKNLIVKAATSPFSLLSSMFGGGQDFSSVQFAIGSSKLSTPEEQKLTALAKVLADRPGLKMEIKGYVERERDAEGYRRELLDGKLRNEKFLELAKERLIKEGESAESLQILPVETSKFLKTVYRKEKFPKPRNAIGMIKDLPDDEMRKLIIANTLVGEPELQKLARERAGSVMDYLVKKGGLPSERLFQKNDDIHKAPEKEGAGRSRVEFNAIAQ